MAQTGRGTEIEELANRATERGRNREGEREMAKERETAETEIKDNKERKMAKERETAET